MAGDGETGVTIHRTTEELDAGPIAAQRAFPIGPEDDAGAVYERAAEVAAELLDEVLPSPGFAPQPEEGVTYAEKLAAADRELDLRDRRTRTTGCGRSRRTSAPAPAARAPGDDLAGAVEDGALVPVEVQPDGGRRMAYDEFLRGLR